MNGLPSPGKLTDQIPNFITYEFFKIFSLKTNKIYIRDKKKFFMPNLSGQKES